MNRFDQEAKMLLSSAFASELNAVPHLTHAECVELRHSISMLNDADIIQLLPQVMIDLIETHTNDLRDTQYAEDIIVFLEPVDRCDSGFKHVEMPLPIVDKEFVATEQMRLFSKLSAKQAAAIAHWLRAAILWEDLLFVREHVELSLRYWGHKM